MEGLGLVWRAMELVWRTWDRCGGPGEGVEFSASEWK